MVRAVFERLGKKRGGGLLHLSLKAISEQFLTDYSYKIISRRAHFEKPIQASVMFFMSTGQTLNLTCSMNNNLIAGWGTSLTSKSDQAEV